MSSNNHTNLVDAEKVFAISENNRIVKNIMMNNMEQEGIGGEITNVDKAR